MDQTQPEDGKGHKRTRSAVKATRPRSSTKGPLDAADPLAPPPATSQPSTTIPPPSSSSTTTPTPAPIPPSPNPQLIPQQTPRMHPSHTPRATSPLPRSPALSPTPGTPRRPPPGSTAPLRPKDFSFLLRPEIFHPLTPLNIPPAFRNSTKQPPPETPLPELLEKGHFRAAAISAVQTLTGTGRTPQQPDPSDHVRIFDLLYTRWACLTLINSTDLAAQEVKALGDLNSAFYLSEDPTSGKTHHLVPWGLRVLNVRLQAIGFGDLRRAVMSYYELAREARVKLGEAMGAHDNSSRELWRERLEDLGVRVAGALVEMGDVKGAGEHLRGLKVGDGGKMEMMRALLWLRLGDVDAARGCVMNGEGRGVTRGEKVVLALCDMADGEYEEAVAKWRELEEEEEGDEMVMVNLAVCLLYVGRMQEGRALLEGMVDAGRSSHTLLFNLTTMYELCTERARSLKVRLSEKVAAMEETNDGWEKTNADFKL
ncbi:hypothetical protein QC762_606920 [Podospora pseudocomata]|uniref:Trafficking protein particle complex subunit 12 n=1 Tax=Podospora pseudocomata TaxID=2093779 RepID=A0ABR0G8I4_9PEZI|nr:hypothetical protein QC762_606920 [Podospora pseudocomata]